MAISLPQHMRASQWTSSNGGLDRNLHVTSSASLPSNATSLPKDQTLVKVAYTSLNPVDYKLPELPVVSRFGFSKPAIPCLDYAGTVAESTLPHLKPGEPVFGKTEPLAFGAAAEYIVVGKQGCVPLPPEVPMDQAACLGVTGLTAYQCIAPFAKSGDRILINGGSGGTGTFGIQIAKALGCHVTATCSGANVDLCKSLGADEVIDYRTQPVVQTLTRAGRQYDLIVDNVFADPDLYWNAHHYLKPEGTFVTISVEMSFQSVASLLKFLMLPTWLGGGKSKSQFVSAMSNVEHYAVLAKWMAEGKVKAVIQDTYELENLGEAFAKLKSGRTRGKIVVKI